MGLRRSQRAPRQNKRRVPLPQNEGHSQEPQHPAGHFCLCRFAAHTPSASTRTETCIRVATQLHRGSPRDAVCAELEHITARVLAKTLRAPPVADSLLPREGGIRPDWVGRLAGGRKEAAARVGCGRAGRAEPLFRPLRVSEPDRQTCGRSRGGEELLVRRGGAEATELLADAPQARCDGAVVCDGFGGELL